MRIDSIVEVETRAEWCVNGDWPCQWEMAICNSTESLDRSPNCRRSLRLCQMWCKSVHGGLWASGWNMTKMYLFIYKCIYWYLFREITYRSEPSTDFHAWWLKQRGLAQCVPFGGEIPPNPLQLLGVDSRFQSKRAKCFILSKFSCYWNYYIDFNQVLHNDRDHQIVIVVGPNTPQQIQDGGRPPFKNTL